ncbi:CCA tRNA nucleotidyltransferase [Campylobacter sp. MIT 12-8780]|uniref:CCA tRNA nucleotidyltransferase n=1 Tax=unclassified Campylobacter TaxID=2593542 RepID=UPI00115F39DA|nr:MULTISPECIES: CCA tRNA nucleotidyltransferase [unclassified Campylobacter]NDJ26925.1 CCA tRNA nucleotidyltransferase [Campylobacter sp. MIT 19-121]TQR41931.1 CCA tRNA nucleotidyltransferase [Campylobacter sp. MIT 12-8780]
MQISKISLKNKANLDFIKEYFKPYTKRAYLVGGSVRDMLLGLELNDFDIEFYDISLELFDELCIKLGASGVGKSFFVYKYKNFDLALARTENKIAYGHKGFKIHICNDEKVAARRRDFTINSMMINIFTEEFLDFYQGKEDLERKILRCVDAKSFVEDSLRVLRAVHFIARFKLDIEPKSLELMQSMDISDLSLERINAELYKFFKASDLVFGFEALQSLNLEQKLFLHDTSKNEKLPFLKQILRSAREFIADEALFLYVYLNLFCIDKKAFFERTKLKKELLQKTKQDFFQDEVKDFELLYIACQMPLCQWLGLWDKTRIQRAKELNVYHQAFQCKVNAKELEKQGFKGKELGDKIKLLQQEKIKNYLQNKEKNEKLYTQNHNA